MNPSNRIRLRVHPSLEPELAEIGYVLRTLARTAGFSYELDLSGVTESDAVDIYYGPDAKSQSARIAIRYCGLSFRELIAREPDGLTSLDGLEFLDLVGSTHTAAFGLQEGRLYFENDIVAGSFWLLTGAREASYPRDRRDNLDLEGSVMRDTRLYSRPMVSQYADRIRTFLSEHGRQPVSLPWIRDADTRAALAFTHDVDYPEIIRWLEALRLIGRRGAAARSLALGVLRGDSHFWVFDDWVRFEREFGVAPAFYFMAKRGSLLRYAAGTPDAFYDVRSDRFKRLFASLAEAGCEIGLHASYHAYRGADRLQAEKDELEAVCGQPVMGVRHHYWHLEPAAPHATIEKQERVGLAYDSSLGFEFYPGFRRGICHPFRVFHHQLRRELDVVELPPTWMDDHFDRRLARNGIEDPVATADDLLGEVRRVNGIAVLDYHVRGMNGDFYPRYGPWLESYLARISDTGIACMQPRDLARAYTKYERSLERESIDRTPAQTSAHRASGLPKLEIVPLREQDIAAVARLHCQFFGSGEVHGHSIAKLGPQPLSGLFYRPNLDNPHFHCDVARVDDEVVAWSVYATRRQEVFRYPLRNELFGMARSAVGSVLKRPVNAVSLLRNLRYAVGERLPVDSEVEGWWIVAGVLPRYRSQGFEQAVGANIASTLFDRMEQTMMEVGCKAWYGVVRPENQAINRFLLQREARPVANAQAQGLEMTYYVKHLSGVPEPAHVDESGRS